MIHHKVLVYVCNFLLSPPCNLSNGLICIAFCLLSVWTRHGYEAQCYEAEAKPKLWSNHEAEAEAEAFTFSKQEAEAEAEALAFSKYEA